MNSAPLLCPAWPGLLLGSVLGVFFHVFHRVLVNVDHEKGREANGEYAQQSDVSAKQFLQCFHASSPLVDKKILISG
jgi:hypothetical protein